MSDHITTNDAAITRPGYRVMDLRTQLMLQLIKDCQDILTGYLVPDGYDSDKAVEALLGILDGPRWRACRDAIRGDGFDA